MTVILDDVKESLKESSFSHEVKQGLTTYFLLRSLLLTLRQDEKIKRKHVSRKYLCIRRMLLKSVQSSSGVNGVFNRTVGLVAEEMK